VEILRTTYCGLLRHVLVSQHNPALSGRGRCLRREVVAGEGIAHLCADVPRGCVATGRSSVVVVDPVDDGGADQGWVVIHGEVANPGQHAHGHVRDLIGEALTVLGVRNEAVAAGPSDQRRRVDEIEVAQRGPAGFDGVDPGVGEGAVDGGPGSR
jgi:hypothetical protein